MRVVMFDIGGVVLTNGWDRVERATLAREFGLDPADFEARHWEWADDLEAGRLPLNDYLDRMVFREPRPFTREQFVAAMEAQSQPLPGMLELVRALRQGAGAGGGSSPGNRGFLLCALNNESRELNRYRIDTFGLRELFDVFFSSCYLGVTKPDPAIFRLALDLTQAEPGECVFVDDRPANAEAAASQGMRAIVHRSLEETRAALAELGIGRAEDRVLRQEH
ncbi:MAG TPA: HAD family phosphatase [Longimicrobiales bacterium]